MTKDEHHMLCLGVLAGIFAKAVDLSSTTILDDTDKEAIIEAVASAEAHGLPVSLERLALGKPIFKMENQ